VTGSRGAVTTGPAGGDVPATVGALLAHAAGQFAATEALVDDRHRLTFAELSSACTGVAKAMVAAGVGSGDRVAVWAPNVAEWALAALGALTIGAVVVPVNTRFTVTEASEVIGRSNARLAVATEGFLGRGYASELLAADLPHLDTVVAVTLPSADRPAPAVPDGATGWDDFLDRGAEIPDVTVDALGGAVRPDDISDIIFTSGTTGRPKGVMATHAQSVRAFAAWGDVVGLTHGDRYLVVNPFFHTFGYKAGILASLVKGATVVCEPVFDANTVLERIAAERISMLPGPPTLYLSLLELPARADVDLSSLRLAVTGAATVPEEMIRRMYTDLGFDTVITGYGLTEATGVVTMCRAGDDPVRIATTSGRAIDGVEVAVVDNTNASQPPGTPGEVVCRGYNVMRGYLDDPEATAETIDANGWLHTGDIGVLDADGYLRITDRLKDMFIVGGFNAYPAEIENTLSDHPGVAQVAVVGMPDDRLGEVGWAWVVPRRDAGADPDALASDITDWAREHLANYKVPRRVVVVDTLPTNASGKVLKYELRHDATTTGRPGGPGSS